MTWFRRTERATGAVSYHRDLASAGLSTESDERFVVEELADDHVDVLAMLRDASGIDGSELTKLQVIRALRAAGKWDALKAALAGASEDVREDWEAANTLRRNDPLIATFASALGITEAELDTMWTAALRGEA